MHIKFNGTYSLQEFEKSIQEICEYLSKEGVIKIHGINLYITCRDDNDLIIELVDSDGEDLILTHVRETASKKLKIIG